MAWKMGAICRTNEQTNARQMMYRALSPKPVCAQVPWQPLCAGRYATRRGARRDEGEGGWGGRAQRGAAWVALLLGAKVVSRGLG